MLSIIGFSCAKIVIKFEFSSLEPLFYIKKGRKSFVIIYNFTTFAVQKEEMELSMFDTLLSLPLFQGLGRADLTRIIESTRLSFSTVPCGTTFIHQGEMCSGVTFIISGSVDLCTSSSNAAWSVTETMNLPTIVGADVLYGCHRQHRFSCTAQSSTRLMVIDKRTFAALTTYFEVFRLNLLNFLSTSIARHHQPLWQPPASTLEARLVDFFRSHVERPAGRKCFNISLSQLAAYMGDDPRYVSRALHGIQQCGLLSLGRRMIDIPALEHLSQV